MKGQAVVDHLADLPLLDYQPLQMQFPDKDILFAMEDSEQKDPQDELQWHMYFDGAINRKGRGIGAVLATPQGQLIPFTRKMTFPCTNNEAEYEAYILGLQVTLELDMRKLHVHGDAMLVISQVNGDWKTKDPKLVPYHEYLLKLIEEFEETASLS